MLVQKNDESGETGAKEKGSGRKNGLYADVILDTKARPRKERVSGGNEGGETLKILWGITKRLGSTEAVARAGTLTKIQRENKYLHKKVRKKSKKEAADLGREKSAEETKRMILQYRIYETKPRPYHFENISRHILRDLGPVARGKRGGANGQ